MGIFLTMTLETIFAVSLWMIVPLGLIGSLLHFLFDWTGHNRLIAIIAAVNESYWEHIKIAVWPVFLLQLTLFVMGGFEFLSFIPAATIGLYSIPIAMVGLVFLYKSLTHRNVLWLDICIFFVVVALSQILFVLILNQLDANVITVVISVFFLTGFLAAFIRFTTKPPREPDVFIDPLNKKYGIDAHPDI